MTAMGEQSEYFWLVTPSWRRIRHSVHAPQNTVQQASSQQSGQQLAGIWSRVRIALRTLQTMQQVTIEAMKRKSSATCACHGGVLFSSWSDSYVWLASFQRNEKSE